VQFVSAPYRGRNGWHQIKDPLRASEVVRDADRARDRVVRIRDGASAPSADLIAKQPEPSGESRPDRAFDNDATLSSPLVPDRRGLDDEPAIGNDYLQRGMVESAPRTMFDEGCDPS
jgi:hypothetical protein